MRCIICKDEIKNNGKDDIDLCHTCEEVVKTIAKHPDILIEYFRKKANEK